MNKVGEKARLTGIITLLMMDVGVVEIVNELAVGVVDIMNIAS